MGQDSHSFLKKTVKRGTFLVPFVAILACVCARARVCRVCFGNCPSKMGLLFRGHTGHTFSACPQNLLL